MGVNIASILARQVKSKRFGRASIDLFSEYGKLSGGGSVSIWPILIQDITDGGGQIIFYNRFHDELLDTH